MGTDHSPSILLHSSRLCPKPVEGTPPVERHARAEPGTAEEGVKGQTAVAMKSELTSVCASGGLLKARRFFHSFASTESAVMRASLS